MTRTKKRHDARAPTPLHDDDDDNDGISVSQRTQETTSSSRPQTPDELIAALTDIGFDGASVFVVKHGFDRVLAALERALSRPPGLIQNVPGYIRSLVTQRGPIPKPDRPAKPADKYRTGKYGNIVRT